MESDMIEETESMKEYYCCYCGRNSEFVRYLISSPATTKGQSYICNICVYDCVEFIELKEKEKSEKEND